VHTSFQTHSRASLRVFFLLLSLLGVLALVIMACGGSSDNSGTSVGSNGSSAQSTTPPKQAHFKVGDQVKIGGTELVSINSFKTNPGDEFDQPKAGNRFVVVDITIKNVGSEEQDISSVLDFTFKDAAGQLYNDTFLDGMTAPDGKIEPGDLLKGQMVYEVPKTQTNFTFAFEADFLATGQTIWDLHV
jgi:hypothetical protein